MYRMQSAHTKYFEDIDRLTVLVGAHRIIAKEPMQKRFRINKLVVHPNFMKPRTFNYDIGMIRVIGRIPFNRFIQPICVDSSGFPPNTTCMVTGWGWLNSGK